MRHLLVVAMIATCSACAATGAARAPGVVNEVVTSDAPDAQAAGMLDVATLAPGIQIDMRYAGRNNFVGAPITGYDAPKCLLLAPVAEALARVQADVAARGQTLVVYDCYRPVRAVQHFMRWANDPEDQRTKTEFYPRLEKPQLLDGYIAEKSGHSRGATVDLGLMRCDAAGACEPLDMGTDFDFFDTRANTASREVTAAQRANRQLLVEAMRARGFANYALEWWHYTLRPEPAPGTAYDFPIR